MTNEAAAPEPPCETDAHFRPAGSGTLKPLFPGVFIRTASGERMMLSVVTLEEGSVVPGHEHPHEQVGYLVSGTLDFTVGNETRRLKAGDQWIIPGGVRHQCVAIGGPAVALDIFNPPREDYR